MDASNLLTESLDWVFQAQQNHGAEYVGFYIDAFTRNTDFPVIENWFMAAVPGSSFIERWFNIFDRSIIRGGVERYLESLRERGVYERFVQGIAGPGYLTMHVAAQDVLQSASLMPNMVLLRAEDSAFFYQCLGRWRRPAMCKFLLLQTAPVKAPALVKIRGGDRKRLELYLRAGVFNRESLLGKALAEIGPAA